MSIRARFGACVLALILLGAACTGSAPGRSPSEAPVPASPETPSPVATGKGSSQAALERLCPPRPKTPSPEATSSEGPTPPAIAGVEREVEEVRGLRFLQPVQAEPVSHRELVEGFNQAFDAQFPSELFARRSKAWQTIGALPPGASIRHALRDYSSSQVIGYYDTTTGELKFLGTQNLSPLAHVVLAHELTHAIDDQHFRLDRVDELTYACQDEAVQAALGAVEGNAQYFSAQVALRFLSLQDQLSIAAVPIPSTAGIPPFILREQEWPYLAGMTFISTLASGGGLSAVNQALRHLPVSTEQIIHPERYPNDVPQPVDIRDLGLKLGSGWGDLDVQQVGEEWLSNLLGLRLDRDRAGAAAAGWDGGLYRAWSDGGHVAVVLSTVWDTANDAGEFANATQEWIDAGSGQRAVVLPPSGNEVTVMFASDAQTLADLRGAIG